MLLLLIKNKLPGLICRTGNGGPGANMLFHIIYCFLSSVNYPLTKANGLPASSTSLLRFRSGPRKADVHWTSCALRSPQALIRAVPALYVSLCYLS